MKEIKPPEDLARVQRKAAYLQRFICCLIGEMTEEQLQAALANVKTACEECDGCDVHDQASLGRLSFPGFDPHRN
jgi:hypothetical protein